MKRFFFSVILLLSASLSLHAQIQSSCAVPPALLRAYQNEIKDLALYRLYQIKSPDTALIEIPQAPQDTVAAAFAAVLNLGKQWEADSIFLNYCVHSWPAHPLLPASIRVKVNPDSGWTKEWANGNTITGYTALDHFLNLHSVRMVYYQYNANFSDYLNHWATLSAGSAINMKALQDSLAKFPGVLYFDRAPGYGDGDHIFYTKDSNAHLSFFAGWGDCPAGCTGFKNWKYTVSLPDCKVWKDTIRMYFTGYNDDNRRLRNCNLAPLTTTQPHTFLPATMLLSPNPAKDKLYINAQSSNSIRFRILNMVGQIVAAGVYADGPINVQALTAGLYTCILSDNTGQTSAMKFMKQ